jgi:hypothetical protein
VFYATIWTKLDLTYICFKKINLSLLWIFIIHLYQLNRPRRFSSFFSQVKFASTQLMSSPPFFLSGAASPPADNVTPPRRVTVSSHWAKMSSLPPLHHPIVSPLEPKLKHWICTTAVGYPPQTVWLFLHCYKNIISTMATLRTTQPCLHFASSLVRAPRHQSSTHHHCSLSPMSHAWLTDVSHMTHDQLIIYVY